MRADFADLKYKTKMSFEGLPDKAWTTQAVKDVVKGLGGDLIEIITPSNRRELEVIAWIRDPAIVGKMVMVEIPEPKNAFCAEPESLEEYAMHREIALHEEFAPSYQRSKKTLVFPVICHVKELIDRGPLLAEDLPNEWLPNEGEDLSRMHKFKTVLGKVDGACCSGV